MRFVTFFTLLLFPSLLVAQPNALHNFIFTTLPTRWDEALPLGNGLLGCLIWQKNGHLRLALDRADLWDERPMAGLDRPEFAYDWVAGQVAKGDYAIVQDYFDAPYEREASPTKLPGGAIEFEIPSIESGFKYAKLDISTGLAQLEWADGKRFETFVHAGKKEGWFRCKGFPDLKEILKLLPPQYGLLPEKGDANSVEGSDLARLGYPQSVVLERDGVWLFQQSGSKGFSYEIALAVRQTQTGDWEGVWSISSHFATKKTVERAEQTVKRSIKRGFKKSFEASEKWWATYWAKSSVSLPDTLI